MPGETVIVDAPEEEQLLPFEEDVTVSAGPQDRP
jgi:hypothetical protein